MTSFVMQAILLINLTLTTFLQVRALGFPVDA